MSYRPIWSRLTLKQQIIAGMVMEGRRNREIADALSTGEQSIKNHMRLIFDKTGVWSRLELALLLTNEKITCEAEYAASHPAIIEQTESVSSV